MRRCLRYAAVLAAATAPLAVASSAQAQDRSPDAPRGWLGVGLDPVFIEDAGSGCATRIRIGAVLAGAPAERAGLRPDDQILAIDGRAVSLADLRRLPLGLTSGDTLHLSVRRDGREYRIAAVAATRPARPPAMPTRQPATSPAGLVIRLEDGRLVAAGLDVAGAPAIVLRRGIRVVRDGEPVRLDEDADGEALRGRVRQLLDCVERSRTEAVRELAPATTRIRAELHSVAEASRALDRARRGLQEFRIGGIPAQLRLVGEHAVSGAEFVELNDDLASYFDGARGGLLVVRVGAGTPAERAGLRAGDVITAADGDPIRSVGGLRAAVRGGEGPLILDVVRRGDRRTVRLPRE